MAKNIKSNPLKDLKIKLNTMLAQALNVDTGLKSALFKVNYNGDLCKVSEDGGVYKVDVTTGAELKEGTVVVTLSPMDGSKPTQLGLGAGMLNLFAEYNVLLYKQAHDNEIERENYFVMVNEGGVTHYHSDNLSDFPLDPTEHEDWRRTPNHDLSLLDGATTIDPALRQLPVVLQSGKNCEVVIHDSSDAFWNEIRLKEACYILESIQPDSYTSHDLRVVRHYFKHLCSQEMKGLADKLVTVPLIIDGMSTPSVCSQDSDSAP